jgi:hypothetical protein
VLVGHPTEVRRFVAESVERDQALGS